MIPPSEASLYGHINWSLAQVQQQSSMGLSLSFHLRGVAKPGHGLGSISLCKKRTLAGSSGASLAKRPHLVGQSGNKAHASGKKSTVSTSSTDTRRKRDIGVSTPDVS